MTDINDFEDDYDFVIEDERPELEAICFKLVEYWMEDYTFEELLEEFDILPEEAFYVLVKAGLVDEDSLEAYLNSDN